MEINLFVKAKSAKSSYTTGIFWGFYHPQAFLLATGDEYYSWDWHGGRHTRGCVKSLCISEVDAPCCFAMFNLLNSSHGMLSPLKCSGKHKWDLQHVWNKGGLFKCSPPHLPNMRSARDPQTKQLLLGWVCVRWGHAWARLWGWMIGQGMARLTWREWVNIC